ncbi:hypothetical protein [Streptomyces sp. NPDC002738]
MYIAAGSLTAVSWWAALVPAAALVVCRVVRRAVMLSQRDATAPQCGPRPGFWRTLQAWAGWHLPGGVRLPAGVSGRPGC